MNWTISQQQAIDERNNNIIVSAGAGSGKTAVLKERVEKLIEKDNIDIDNLLMLTFTNAAAAEMKGRIRDRISKSNIKLDRKNDLLNKIDSCQITTFDAYALFLVQKYHYLLGVKKDINIIDENILNIQKNTYLEEILQEYYAKKDPHLISFIKNFTRGKDDNSLKEIIFKIDKFFEKYYQKDEMLENYIKDFYNPNNYNKLFSKYEEYLLDELKNIRHFVDEYKNCFNDMKKANYICGAEIDNLLNSKSYQEMKTNIGDFKFNKMNKIDDYFYDDEAKVKAENIKKIITKKIKTLTDNLFYSEDDLINLLDSSKDTASLLIDIEIKLNKKINEYKKENNLFDFPDIFRMAINIVDEKHSDIRDEIKNNYKEILIDEYQDTNDLQEQFINFIANNNVYCVGDIKQSIYRFRNAQPDIFQKKYEAYSKNINGIAINLKENFRSRKEVVDTVNMIFKPIMDLEIGGDKYSDHLMANGNTAYTNTGEDYSLKILSYDNETLKNIHYKNNEVEAFIIGQDIKKKIQDQFKVNDKDYNSRPVDYSDFCILMQKSTDFDIYKSILTSLQIPVNIIESEKMTNSEIFTVFKSLFKLLVDVVEKRYDNQTKIDYLSICRSFIYQQSDKDNHDAITSQTFYDTELIKIIKEIANGIENKTVSMILDEFINKFNIYDKLRYINDTDINIAKINYIYQMADQFTSAGNNYKDFNQYLDNIFSDENKEIKFNMEKSDSNAVKLMTIHKAKGLQFKICYFPQLNPNFNRSDTSSKTICDKDYGISLPVLDKNYGIISTFNNEIIKRNIIKKDIAEKIRLLYVALTRAEEQIILVYPSNPSNSNYDDLIPAETRLNWKSFADMLNSNKNLNKYVNTIDLNELSLNNNYRNTINTIFNNLNTTNNEEIVIHPLKNIKTEEITENHFSKSVGLIDKELKETLQLGTDIHYYLELVDFLNPDLSFIDKKYRKYIEKFIKSDLMRDIASAKIYKEYEFIFSQDNQKQHGIIDLLLEYPDHFTIIDYKLKNIDDDHYNEQLKGYRQYIQSISNKPVNCFLYSILTSEVHEII